MPEGNEVGGGGTCPAAGGAEGSGDDEFEVPVGGCVGLKLAHCAYGTIIEGF